MAVAMVVVAVRAVPIVVIIVRRTALGLIVTRALLLTGALLLFAGIGARCLRWCRWPHCRHRDRRVAVPARRLRVVVPGLLRPLVRLRLDFLIGLRLDL